MLKIALVAVAVAFLAPSEAAQTWSYDDIEGWQRSAAVCSNGKRQSPIDVETAKVQIDPLLAGNKLVFDRYSGAYSGQYLNNGHTVQFNINASLPNARRPQIYGGGLGEDVYIFEQFHLHWGDDGYCRGAACKGAEHTIDGESAPAEIHFVHFNAKYGNLGEADKHSDGLAVVGFLFQVVNDPRYVETDYTKAAALVPQIKAGGQKISTFFEFGKFIPTSALDGSDAFYRYDGSLTTPPCLEVVTCTLFDTRVPILASTLDAFLDAAFEDRNNNGVVVKNILNNYRPPQPLYGRIVKTNRRRRSTNQPFIDVIQASSAAAVWPTLPVMLLAAVFLALPY